MRRLRFVRLLEGVYRDLGFVGFTVNFADRAGGAGRGGCGLGSGGGGSAGGV